MIALFTFLLLQTSHAWSVAQVLAGVTEAEYIETLERK